MQNLVFPIITEFDLTLPYSIVGVGFHYEQEYIHRPNGFPYYQWIQCKRGCGELILGDNRYTVSENQGMLLYPDERHEYYAISDNWEVDWIIFNGQYMADFFSLTAKVVESGVYYISQPHTIADKIKQIYEIELSDSPVKSIEVSRMTYDILMDILKYTSEKMDSCIVNRYDRIKPLLLYIEENYARALSLSELSQIVGITPQHLCNSFKKITTHTITEYINMVRVKKSKELILQDRDLQVKDIARQVGFQDVSYFCSTFRKIVKMSPVEFKNILS